MGDRHRVLLLPLILPVFLCKLGTVDPRRIATSLGVDEELGVHHVPLYVVEVAGLLLPFVISNFGVVDKQLVTPDGLRGATFSARAPGAISPALGVNVVRHHARHRHWVVIGHYGRYGRIHDKRDQEQKGKYRQDGGCP